MNFNGRIILGAVIAAIAMAGCGDNDDGGGDEQSDDAARAALEKLDSDVTAKRVSELRGLEFTKSVPETKIVSPKEVTSFLRRQVARNYPDDRLKADEAFYQLAGMIPAGQGLRELLDRFGANLILGFYDPKDPDALKMVTNERAARPKFAESTLAHELNHALQDQNFAIERVQGIKDPERAIAGSALLEGDSQLLELVYGKTYLGGGPKPSSDMGGLPPAFLLYAAFPYQVGSKFVAALIKKGDGYELVDKAWRKLPETSEQVLHPEKYLSGEGARAVRLRAGNVLGDAWKGTGAQSFGELDGLAMLSTKALPEGAALKKASEGWDGGAREVFTRGEDRALVVTTTWESADDADEFAAAYARSLKTDRKGRASGGVVEIPDVGFATVAADGRDVTLAIAPEAKLAERLVKSG